MRSGRGRNAIKTTGAPAARSASAPGNVTQSSLSSQMRGNPNIHSVLEYSAITGVTRSLVKGGAKYHQMLLKAFAEHLLHVKVDAHRLMPPTLDLSVLRLGFDVPQAEVDGFNVLQVKSISLLSPDTQLNVDCTAMASSEHRCVTDLLAEKLPLEERFTFYGGGIAHIRPGATSEPAVAADPWTPVHGPFSADFGWVTLDDWTHGPIRCTDGQAAVFSALWSFKGAEVDGERIMTRAGQTSDKPIDLFKVKTANKGKPEYEGPLHAYRALVKSNRRQGVYWMGCCRFRGHRPKLFELSRTLQD